MRKTDVGTALVALSRDRRGATATEYALIIASLGAFVVAGATAFGNSLNTTYQSNRTAMNNAVDSSFDN